MKKLVLSISTAAIIVGCAPIPSNLLPPALFPPPPAPSTVPTPEPSVIPTRDLSSIAHKVFVNETGGDYSKLVAWNEREDFASLGIGHFIWYPQGRRGPYTETFPGLLEYIKENAVPLPRWLAERPVRGAPWPDRASFERAQNDPQVRELRNFLQKTMSLQANYMAARLSHALPKMMERLPPRERDRLLKNYQAVEHSPQGLYPLLDYVNFKGEGVNPNESYRGQGWGLKQVLLRMEPVKPGPQALAEFARAADDVLLQRIANAPANRSEARWLAGWRKRVATYRPDSLLRNKN